MFWGIQVRVGAIVKQRKVPRRRERGESRSEEKGRKKGRMVKIGEKEQSEEKEQALGRSGRGEVQRKCRGG